MYFLAKGFPESKTKPIPLGENPTFCRIMEVLPIKPGLNRSFIFPGFSKRKWDRRRAHTAKWGESQVFNVINPPSIG